jgi:GNAT superfamily N-acetyltransferase
VAGPEGAAYYGGLIGDDGCLLALARDSAGDRTLGHLVGKLSPPNDLRGATFAVLESIRVDPAARSQGVGTALVAHFFEWARTNGAEQAGVTAYAGNDEAQRFYLRHGFEPMSVTFRRKV